MQACVNAMAGPDARIAEENLRWVAETMMVLQQHHEKDAISFTQAIRPSPCTYIIPFVLAI